MATPEQTDQQRRVIMETKAQVEQLLDLLGELGQRLQTYTRLGLGDDQFLSDDAFEGSGTTKAEYRGAITSLDAIQALLASGHGTNLERFAR
jgi:hypothetical protein